MTSTEGIVIMPVAERICDDRRGRAHCCQNAPEAERAQNALTASPVYDIRRLEVDRHEGNVVISGSVSSFYFKQLAQELVLAEVGEGDQVCNEVEVR
jgi:hypothetical protein